VATGPQPPGHHARWLADVRGRVGALDLRAITLLQPRRGYTPDFLSPPPSGPSAGIGDDLGRIRATPPDQVAAEIARSLADTPGAAESAIGRRLLGDPAKTLGWLAGLITDVGFQSQRLAAGGLDRLFAELHPDLSWHDNTLTRALGDDDHRELTGEGLVLMPSAFKWDQVVVVLDDPWQPTVIYPARGSGTLWQQLSGTPDAALGRLIGRTRAALLLDLAEPTTTTALAHRHALAPATVSQHLIVLRDAGFIVGERHRHEIHYRRTPLGTAAIHRHR
jgi:DNA-binding transcriptional ArsR family regulator